jgi:hypothetical protein
MAVPKKWAPFSDEEVKFLQLYQQCKLVHPYTCSCGDHVVMEPSHMGFYCHNCGRTQAWVLAGHLSDNFIKGFITLENRLKDTVKQGKQGMPDSNDSVDDDIPF